MTLELLCNILKTKFDLELMIKKAFDRQILEIIGIGKSPVNFGLGEISTFSLRF